MATANVVKILHLVDTDDPVLAGEGLLDGAECWAAVRQTHVTDTVSNLTLGEQGVVVVVRHLVQQAVLHGVGGTLVDAVLAASSEEIALLNLIGPDTFGNTNHPQELVDVISRVAQETTKDNQHVVDFVLAHDLVADLFARGHGLTNGGNVRVVPGVVVHESGSVSHTTNLVTVIPPRHDLGVFLGVLTEPLVRLSVVINDMLAAVGHAAGKNDRWRRVGVGGDPCAVRNEHEQVNGHGGNNGSLGDVAKDANNRLVATAKTAGLGSLLGALGLSSTLFGSLGRQERIQDLRGSNSSSNTDNRGESQHETHHDTSEVAAEQGVYNNEDMLILQIAEAEVDTSGEQPDEHVQVEEEGGPGGGLMLRNGCDDGNVDLGVACIPERVESTTPRRNVSERGESNETEETDSKSTDQNSDEESLELLA